MDVWSIKNQRFDLSRSFGAQLVGLKNKRIFKTITVIYLFKYLRLYGIIKCVKCIHTEAMITQNDYTLS